MGKEQILQVLYLGACVLFILGLKRLEFPEDGTPRHESGRFGDVTGRGRDAVP